MLGVRRNELAIDIAGAIIWGVVAVMVGIFFIPITGCMSISDEIDDDLNCFSSSLGEDNGVTDMGSEQAVYELVAGSSDAPPPLVVGTRGFMHSYDFDPEYTVLENSSRPAVLQLGDFSFNAGADGCGVQGTFEALSSGTTEVTLSQHDTDAATWQLQVLEPFEMRITSFWFDEVTEEETLTLVQEEEFEILEIGVGVYDAESNVLSYLESTTWKIVSGDEVVSIGLMQPLEGSEMEDEFVSMDAPVGKDISMKILVLGEAVLEVRVGDLLTASFSISIE
ncbi:MAG: hypothetical protein GY847_24905 [Proteobacteria bacterium]|nr:hypothetical protein [Pseudomonadota bacterium]